jgi:membrane associated rhomboid family serine protease
MARDHLQNRPKRIGEDVIFTNNNRKREFFTRGERRGTYDYSRYRSTKSDTSVVWLLIGANAMVYLAWQEPENFRTMRTHFLVSESALANGYWHTALTAAFSHNSFNHLFGNMFTLYFFGRDVALACGGAYLLNLYLVGGVVASLAHVGYERYERRKRRPHVGFFDKREHDSFFSWFDERMDKIARLAAPASLGASGAVNAIIAMSVLMMPHRKIYLYGILPLESWVFGAIFLLRDYIGLGTNDGVGHSAHLGGAATGALAFLLRNGRMMR